MDDACVLSLASICLGHPSAETRFLLASSADVADGDDDDDDESRSRPYPDRCFEVPC